MKHSLKSALLASSLMLASQPVIANEGLGTIDLDGNVVISPDASSLEPRVQALLASSLRADIHDMLIGCGQTGAMIKTENVTQSKKIQKEETTVYIECDGVHFQHCGFTSGLEVTPIAVTDFSELTCARNEKTNFSFTSATRYETKEGKDYIRNPEDVTDHITVILGANFEPKDPKEEKNLDGNMYYRVAKKNKDLIQKEGTFNPENDTNFTPILHGSILQMERSIRSLFKPYLDKITSQKQLPDNSSEEKKKETFF